MKERYHHIDIIETVAILFVVIYHSRLDEFDFIENASRLFYIRYFLRTILSTCVPLFFFANGYLLFSKRFDLQKHIHRTVKLSLLPLFGLVLMPTY